MGTTNESSRTRDEEEAEEIIPWKFVPQGVRQELVRKLNPTAAMNGNDWRMLASELGYTIWDISYIESEKDNNTKVLFSQYDSKPEASFNDVYRCLVKMQRQDCVDVLNAALSEIKQLYKQARELHMFHIAGTSGGHYPWSSQPCPCTYSSHQAICGSHPYCICGLGFSSCACPSHNHPGHSPYLGHQRQIVRPGFSHPETTQTVCMPSFSSCQTSPILSHVMKEPYSCHDRIAQPSPSGYGILGNSPASKLTIQENPVYSQRATSVASPGHVGYQGSFSDTGKAGDTVEPKFLGNQPCVNLSNGVVGMDKPAAVETSLRSQASNRSIQSGTSSSTSEGYNGRKKIARQYSNDKATPDLNRDKRFRTEDSSRTVAVSQHGVAQQGTTGPAASSTAQLRHADGSHNNVGGCLSHHDRQYEHVTVKVENVKSSREGKHHLDSSPNGSQWDRSQTSSTFPMRLKAKTDRTLEDLNNLTISKKSTSMPQNMKPAEYRKAFRHIKVFVTYSYDSDIHAKQVLSLCKFLQRNGFACCVDVSDKSRSNKSKEQLEFSHRKVAEADFVLVCISKKYLQEISSKGPLPPTDHQLHTRDIYEFMHAKYLREQQNYSDGNGGPVATPYFVPLLFPDMTVSHIPEWMMNGPTYNWPEQYMDLAWMLTKPQERIKAVRDYLSERERKNCDHDGAFGMDTSHT